MAQSFKEKYAAAKAKLATRARAAGGKAITHVKPFAMGGGGGFAAYHLEMMARKNLDFARNTVWGSPVLLAAAGMLVARKNRDLGLGIAGAAGYSLAFNLASDRTSQGSAAPPPAGTKGVDDTGYVQQPNTAAVDMPDTGAFADDTGVPEDYA